MKKIVMISYLLFFLAACGMKKENNFKQITYIDYPDNTEDGEYNIRIHKNYFNKEFEVILDTVDLKIYDVSTCMDTTDYFLMRVRYKDKQQEEELP